MNLYFYGGSFDPPHLGHKKIISYCSNRSDMLLVIPTYQSPHKSYKPTSFFHRKEMLKLMLSDLSGKLEIIDYENDNKSKYTFETVNFLKNKYPEYTLNMVLGEDQFCRIYAWERYEYILSNVNSLVIKRPGIDEWDEDRNEYQEKLYGYTNIKWIDDISIDISSEDIKNNINNLERIKLMLDENVFDYIMENRLYI